MPNVMAMLKQGGAVLLGIAVFAGIALFAGAMLAGVTVATAFLYPIISGLAGTSILLFLSVVLPLSIFQPLRHAMATISLILSYVCGASVWMFSFLTIILILKWFSLFALMFFQAVAPFACILLLFNGQAGTAGGIVLGLIITYGMRFYGVWIETVYQKKLEGKFEIKVTASTDSAEEITSGSRICPACNEKNNLALLSCWKCGEIFQKQLAANDQPELF
jgi:hypothetical protein